MNTFLSTKYAYVAEPLGPLTAMSDLLLLQPDQRNSLCYCTIAVVAVKASFRREKKH